MFSSDESNLELELEKLVKRDTKKSHLIYTSSSDRGEYEAVKIVLFFYDCGLIHAMFRY